MPLDRVPRQPFYMTVDQGTHRRRCSCFMVCRFPLVLIFMVALGPFADANPPDPIAIGSLCDWDDYYDDVLLPIVPESVLQSALLLDLNPLFLVARSSPPTTTAAPAVATLLAFQFRSPPVP